MAKKIDINELKKNAMFMRRKLVEARKDLEEQEIVIDYDNGGGQTGIRENPSFTAYEKLLKSYQAALKQIEELSGEVPKKKERSNKLTVVGNSKWNKCVS